QADQAPELAFVFQNATAHPQLPTSQGCYALGTERFILTTCRSHLIRRHFARLQLCLGYAPGLVTLAHALFAAVEIPIGVVQVPVGNLDVDQHEVHVALKFGSLLIKAQAGDENTLDAAADVKRRQHAARVRSPNLVNLHAEGLQQRLLELE